MQKFSMLHFENNPRQITKKQFERLKETMSKFGDLSGIVVNLKERDGQAVGELIGGNQRSEAAKFIGSEPVITDEYKKPLDDGTVAYGYYEFEGKRFNARFVQWDDTTAMEANLIANAGGGNWDWDSLSSIPDDIMQKAGFDNEFLMGWNNNALNLREMLNSDNSGEVQYSEEWKGMPEFQQEDQLGVRSIHVHFKSQDDVDRFAELIGQKLTDKTRSIWYPEVEKVNMRDVYENE